MRTTAPLILASGSPRRRQLLEAAGFHFEVFVREVEEDIPAGTEPAAAAQALACRKAEAYRDQCAEHIVLTADTLVSLEGQILGKPADAGEAKDMLRALSGRVNEVHTGICLLHDVMYSDVVTTRVRFAELSDAEIDHYVEVFRPFDKAGAYGIQEWIGMIGIESIEGDYYNVVGLPVRRMYALLKEANWLRSV